MAQFHSEIKFDQRLFFFQPAGSFDQHKLGTRSSTYTSEDLPGLEGSYSFNSFAAMWDGDADLIFPTNLVGYAGNNLTVNAAGFPRAGTVTGYIQGDEFVDLHITGFALRAADILAAAQTLRTADDKAVLKSMLAGDDKVTLSRFSDYFMAQGGNDTVAGGGGHDTLLGLAGQDVLKGAYGDDNLQGGLGQDQLYGGQGKDVLIGGASRDVLDGGADTVKDSFVFRTVAESRAGDDRDVIRNFTNGVDKLDLRALDADAVLAGAQDLTFAGTTATAHAVWYEQTAAGVRLFADVTGDTTAEFELRLTSIAGLLQADVLL